MEINYKSAKLLVVNESDSSRKMLINILKILGIASIDEAYEKTDAWRKFKDQKHDIIIGALISGGEDVVGLAKLVREDPASPNQSVPIIATSGPKTAHLVNVAREVGVTDLLQSPFTVDDILARIKYALSLKPEALKIVAQPQPEPVIEESQDQSEPWPDENEASSLTEMLLDHYMKHHEIVLAKLQFAQTATKQSIEEVRQTHEKVKGLDSTGVREFKDFDKMWEEIIKIFAHGGLAEDELFKIEQIITTIPEDIRRHYDALSQKDQKFLSLVESLNVDAYKKAKAKAQNLQQQPNPLHGKTPEDYRRATASAEENAEAFIFMPEKQE